MGVLWSRWFSRGGRDRGSVALAMLAIILAGGIAVSLAVVMMAGTAATRHDRSYAAALQWADKGVQEALFQANNGLTPVSGSQSGVPGYEWTATTTSRGWVVQSTGRAGETNNVATRRVQARLTLVQRFGVAAFGDITIQLQGSNGANSYNSENGTLDTGNGQLSSNGDINMNGNSTVVDSVVLYNNLESQNTCSNSGGSGCDNLTYVDSKYDVASDANMSFITDQLAACSSVETLPDWVASNNVPGYAPSPAPANVQTPAVLAPRTGSPSIPWCFNTLTFDRDTTVTGNVVVFVRGAISIDPQVRVNCPSCTPSSTPNASTLLIYSAGSTDTEGVSIGNQSYFAGGIFAPRAACLGNPSGAQADIFGSLICGQIGRLTSGNQGGWSFHYDDRLGDIGTGGYRIGRWDEN